MKNKDFGFGTQIRKSPYFDSTVKWGATGFSVYNHMYIPRDFGSPEQNFWNLIEKSILCDVAVERQVEITGSDAFKFTQLLTPRDLSKLAIGQCKYVLITNNEGGILNDPVLLRIAENHFWLSLADSDVLLWAQGVAVNSGLDVKIKEPDVSPLQLQGPTSGEIMIKLFGEDIIDELRDRNLLINDASLTLYINQSKDTTAVPYQLFLYKSDEGANPIYSQVKDLFTEGPAIFGGLLERDNNGKKEKYTFRITDYVSDILSGKTDYSPLLRLKAINSSDLQTVSDTVYTNYNWNPKAVTIFNHHIENDSKKAVLKISYSEKEN